MVLTIKKACTKINVWQVYYPLKALTIFSEPNIAIMNMWEVHLIFKCPLSMVPLNSARGKLELACMMIAH